MRKHISLAAIAAFGVLGLQLTAQAQFTPGATGSGLSSSRNLGGGLSAGSGNVFGGGTGGTEQMGALGTTSGTVDASARFRRENVDAGAFVGVDTESGGGFVGLAGADQAGVQQFRSGVSTQGGRGAQGRGGQGGRGAGRSRIDIRTTVRVGFAYPRPNSARLSANLQARLEKLAGVEFLSSVEVALDGRTATLRGLVATQHDRLVAERLAR